MLHRAALHLGRWIKMENRNNHIYAQPWNEMVLWPHGSIVRHNREIYRSEGLCTAAEPGNLNHYRFHVRDLTLSVSAIKSIEFDINAKCFAGFI